MSDKEFQVLIDRVVKAANHHKATHRAFTDACHDRYGTAPGDVDADYIIDATDYGGCSLTVEQCDREMAQHGFPRKDVDQ